MRTYTKEHPLTVVCFGDSNTRYFLGDTQEDGPEEDSYPARLGRLLEERGIPAQVINAGMPDAQTDYALAQLEPQVLGVGADVCIYGFGTNCVRQPEDDLTGYLRDTKTVFGRLDRAGVRTISLLIPWFDEGYCGKAGQARLRRWNGALAGLCLERGVTMLDTYGAFCREPRRWFSETATPMRHYNADACRVIAEMALAALCPILE